MRIFSEAHSARLRGFCASGYKHTRPPKSQLRGPPARSQYNYLLFCPGFSVGPGDFRPDFWDLSVFLYRYGSTDSRVSIRYIFIDIFVLFLSSWIFARFPAKILKVVKVVSIFARKIAKVVKVVCAQKSRSRESRKSSCKSRQSSGSSAYLASIAATSASVTWF